MKKREKSWFGEGRADSSPHSIKTFLNGMEVGCRGRERNWLMGARAMGPSSPCRPLNQLSLPLSKFNNSLLPFLLSLINHQFFISSTNGIVEMKSWVDWLVFPLFVGFGLSWTEEENGRKLLVWNEFHSPSATQTNKTNSIPFFSYWFIYSLRKKKNW